MLLNCWIKSPIDAGHSKDTLNFDFAKTFNSVPHNCLISTQQGCGISVDWVKNFLMGRKQKAECEIVNLNGLML